MEEYATGYHTVYHADGSSTTYTVEHEPPFEPMSLKASILTMAGLVGVAVVSVAAPIGISEWMLRRDRKKDMKDRQRRNQEIYDKISH